MRTLAIALVLSFCFAGCRRQPAVPLDPNAEYLEEGQGAAGRENVLEFLRHERRGTDRVTVRAILRRSLSRSELRALVRGLVGSAKHPNVTLFQDDESASACAEEDFAALRGAGDPKRARRCSEGTVLWMNETENRLLHWGQAAPKS